MNMPKISIIIPVYNVEKYLQECLDSCVNQTLKEIEIICVDDFSTDSSFDILTRYAKEDSRVRVLSHQINRKQGAARNTGMDNAVGEYIWFVDSDDFIDKNACQLLYDTAKEAEVDLLSFGGISFKDQKGERKYENSSYYLELPINKIVFPSKDWKNINCINLNVSPCMYVTKASVLKRYRFRENVFFEDVDFSSILFASVDSILRINYTGYHRRLISASTTKSVPLRSEINYLVLAAIEIDKYINDNKISYNHFLYVYVRYLVRHINSLILKEKGAAFNQKEWADLKRKYLGFKDLCKKVFYFYFR